MNTYETQLAKNEQIVQNKFNVTNPFLLKTGALGTITELMTQSMYQSREYYNKVTQELNPVLAQDFNSMLFHCSTYGVDIDFAEPATFVVQFIIPKILPDNIDHYEFIIEKNTQFYDSSKKSYIIPEKIEIVYSKGGISAYSYTTKGKIKLSSFELDDVPNSYLVQYTNVKQLSRNIQSFYVSSSNLGEPFEFSSSITSYNNLNKVRVYYSENIDYTLNVNDLYQMDPEEILLRYKFEEFNVKYFNYGSSRFDKDVFLNVAPTSISLKSGDGYRGYLPKEGGLFILDVYETEGYAGNLQRMEFSLNNIPVNSYDINGQPSRFNMTLNGISIQGGSGGKNTESIEDIKNKIYDSISTRNNIVSIKDYQTFFKINGVEPFVDSKYINNNSIIFVYNAFKYQDEVIKTVGLNIPEDHIANNAFYPTHEYQGKTLISPFYFKFKSNNSISAYMVNPKIPIDLYTEYTADSALVQNYVDLFLNYDFGAKKSYLKLENYQDNYTYVLRTNQFVCTLNYENGFQYEIPLTYTDDFCIVKEPLTSFELSIFDEKNNQIGTLFNYLNTEKKDIKFKYYQLIYKQEFNKYYLNFEPIPADEISTDTSISSYLDDELQSILSTIEQLYEPVTEGEIPFVLKVPYIDIDFFNSVDYSTFYTLMDGFFSVDLIQEQIPTSTKVQQTFYNTIYIEDDYTDLIYRQNHNIIKNQPEMKVNLKLTIDPSNLALDTKYNNQQEFLLEFKLSIMQELIRYQGFQVAYYESKIENALYEKFNKDFEIIKNIELISPKLYEVKSADDLYFDLKDKFLTKNDVPTADDVKRVVDFCPPYFHYNSIIDIDLSYSK